MLKRHFDIDIFPYMGVNPIFRHLYIPKKDIDLLLDDSKCLDPMTGVDDQGCGKVLSWHG